MANPFLRWAGSKRKLLPILREYWNPGYKRYVEPFAGSACLFFHLAPNRALLGDINSELIFTYAQVRRNLSEVLSVLRKLKKNKAEYLALRKLKPTSLDDAERAARFIFLNRFCFNGIYRTNQAGEFNVPFGGWRAGYVPSDDEFQACSELLTRARLKATSFEGILEQVRPDDFVYIDPPFSVGNRRVFREYDPSSFDATQIKVLRDWLPKLDKLGAKFLVSYADSREGRNLAAGFEVRRVAVRRNIAGFAASRRRAYELLITN